MGISKLSSKMPKANWLYPCGSVNRCWSTFCGEDAVSLPVAQIAEAESLTIPWTGDYCRTHKNTTNLRDRRAGLGPGTRTHLKWLPVLVGGGRGGGRAVFCVPAQEERAFQLLLKPPPVSSGQ